MSMTKYQVTMDDDIFDLIVYSMIQMKNRLLRECRYTDAVDDPTKTNVKKCISCTACIKECSNDARGIFGPIADASRLAMEVIYRKRKEPEWFL